MKYESQLASRYIKAQKRQSIFTIISIIAAVAIITMVFVLYSVYIHCRRNTAYSASPFHLVIHELTPEQAESLSGIEPIRRLRLDYEKDGKIGAYILFGNDIGDRERWLQDVTNQIGAQELFTKNKYEWNNELLNLDSIGDEAHLSNLRIFCLFFLFAVMIAFALRLVIDTAFEVSSKERERQYGVLQSIGATPEQIVRIITSEGLQLCVIAVPLGLAVGVGLAYLMYHALLAAGLSQIFHGMTNAKLSLPFSVDPKMLLVSAAVGILWVFLSAYGVGMRVIRKTPMEAITTRAADVKKVKRCTLSGLLFGITGSMASRNARRQKKRFAITVLTLTVSITMFATFGTLLNSVEYSITQFIGQNMYDCDFIVTLNAVDGHSYKESEQLMQDSGLFRELGISQSWLVKEKESKKDLLIEYVNEELYLKMFENDPPVSYAELVSSGGYVCDRNNDKYASLSSVIEQGTFPVTTTYYERAEADTDDAQETWKLAKKEQREMEVSVLAAGNAKFTVYSVHGLLIGALETYESIEHDYFCNYESSAECYAYCMSDAEPNAADSEKMSEWFLEHSEEIELLFDAYRDKWMTHNVISAIRTGVLIINVLIALTALINLMNIISTGIANRRSEMASLQCVGMTDGQLAGMTVIECLQFTGVSAILSLLLCVIVVFGTEKGLTAFISTTFVGETEAVRNMMMGLIKFDHVMPFVRCVGASLTAFVAGGITSVIMLRMQRSESLSDQIRGTEMQLDAPKTHLVRNCAIAVAGTAVLVIAGLHTYSVIAYHNDRKAYEQAGYLHLVDTSDGKRNVYHTGAANGKHTIVALAGQGANCFPVLTTELNTLLGEENTIVYPDRAGNGFSEDSHKPQTVEQVVQDYRESLQNDGFQAPYVLMAHSYGGYYAMYWEAAYPEEIEAIVFLDGTPLPKDEIWMASELDEFHSDAEAAAETRRLQMRSWLGLNRLFPMEEDEHAVYTGTAIFPQEALDLWKRSDNRFVTSALGSEFMLEQQETLKLLHLVKPTDTPKLYLATTPTSEADVLESLQFMKADFDAAGKTFSSTPEAMARSMWKQEGWYYQATYANDIKPFTERLGNCRLISCPGEHAIMYAQQPQRIADAIRTFLGEQEE